MPFGLQPQMQSTAPTYYNTFVAPQNFAGSAPTNQQQQAPQQQQQFQSDADVQKFIQDYATKNNIRADDKSDATRRITDALRAQGLNVSYEKPDEYGRSAGIMYNGTPYKMMNGAGNWIFNSYMNEEGANPGTLPPGMNIDQFRNQGLMGSMGNMGYMMGQGQQQNSYDPMAWRRQHYARQFQKPIYNTNASVGGQLNSTGPQQL